MAGRLLLGACVASWGAMALALGCAQKQPPAAEGEDAGEVAITNGAVDASPPREEVVAKARAALAAGNYDGPRIGAMNMVTSVLSAPAWPEADGGAPSGDAGASIRLGYLRNGAKVPVVPLPPIANEGCSEGWYELVQGGYVCGRAATLDLKNPRVRLATSPPDLDAGLPYRYGYNLTNGTPLYRRVLSLEDRKKYEPWLVPAPAPAAGDSAGGDEASESSSSDEGESSPPPPPPPAETAEKRGRRKAPSAAPSASVTPWYMRETDGGRPKVALDELRGRGVLVRRMVRGFYLALDKDFNAAHAHWWRTTGGFAVPFERIFIQPPLTDFHGTFFGPDPMGDSPDGGAQAPDGGAQTESPAQDGGASLRGMVASVKYDGAHKYTIDPQTKKVAMGESLARRRAAGLTGASMVSGGVTFHETTEGFWLRAGDVAEMKPSPRPAEVGPDGKWIDVDLTHQSLVALEGDMPVFATFISSGRHNPVDKEHDYATPSGTFHIREKHVTATMDGDVAADGPYSIEDVPWVMYYQGSYALHGAFWHAQFGHQHSHGCINMAPADARTLFNWVDPHLPNGWHGVFTSGDRPGTLVLIHE